MKKANRINDHQIIEYKKKTKKNTFNEMYKCDERISYMEWLTIEVQIINQR